MLVMFFHVVLGDARGTRCVHAKGKRRLKLRAFDQSAVADLVSSFLASLAARCRKWRR